MRYGMASKVAAERDYFGDETVFNAVIKHLL